MLLMELSNLPGVSGNEGLVRNKIIELVTPLCDKVRVDRCGNVIALVKSGAASSEPPVKVMLTAHMDEVGFIITSIDKKGNLKFKTVGGVDDRILPGKRVLVGPNKVKGVIGSKPIHLQSEKEFKKAYKTEDLRIDIGSGNQKASLKLVEPGDYTVFDTSAERFGDGLISGKALDDRAGCAILIDLLKNITRPSYDLYVCFTVNEEIGLLGAKVLANAIRPDIAMTVEGTTCADVPGVREYETSSSLGKGPVLAIMDKASVSDKDLNRFLTDTAEELDIKTQFKNTVSGGNDAAAMQKASSGAKVASVSVPCRYIHSPLSVLSEKDFNDCLKLMTGFVDKLSKNGGKLYV
jgi:endoglucanase